jgi:hypothetical protein
MSTQKSWCWWSTHETIQNEVLSVTAILETIIAVPLYWLIAINFETYLLLLASALIAPIVLLRSDQSVALGARWFTEWAAALRVRLQSEQLQSSPLAVTVALMSSAAFTYVTSRVFSTILQGDLSAFFSSIPIGWLSLTIAIAAAVAGRNAVQGEAAVSAVMKLAGGVAFTGALAMLAAGANAVAVWGLILGVLLGTLAGALVTSGAPALGLPLFSAAFALAGHPLLSARQSRK